MLLLSVVSLALPFLSLFSFVCFTGFLLVYIYVYSSYLWHWSSVNSQLFLWVPDRPHKGTKSFLAQLAQDKQSLSADTASRGCKCIASKISHVGSFWDQGTGTSNYCKNKFESCYIHKIQNSSFHPEPWLASITFLWLVSITESQNGVGSKESGDSLVQPTS